MKLARLILIFNLLLLAKLANAAGDWVGNFSITDTRGVANDGLSADLPLVNPGSILGGIITYPGWGKDYEFKTYLLSDGPSPAFPPKSIFQVVPGSSAVNGFDIINFRIAMLNQYQSPMFSINYYCGLVGAPTMCTDGMTHQFYLDFNNIFGRAVPANGTNGVWIGISPADSQEIVIVQSTYSS